MPYQRQSNRFQTFTRKWWKPALFVTTFVLVVSAPFLLNFAVKNWIEHYASRLNGAQVTLRSLNLSLVRGVCEIEGIQIAHHTQPMSNLLEIDEVRVEFERTPLLSFKLIVPEVRVQGVRYATSRERSGVLDESDPSAYETTALLDRIAPGVYDSVKAEMGETPLRNLGQVSQGFAMRKSVDPVHQQLEVYQRVKSLENEFDHHLLVWEQENDRLSHGLTHEEKLNRLRALKTRAQQESADLLARLDRVFEAAPKDVERILNKIGLPNLKTDDFTRALIGRRTLNHLERIAYWVDLSRRKMGLSTSSLATQSRHASTGTPAVETAPKDLPRLWIRKAVFSSTAGSDKHRANLSGEIVDIASGPLGPAYPMVINLRGDFPGLRILGLRLRAMVDHSRAEPKEDLIFEVGSFPLSDWAIEQSADLKMIVASGQVGLGFQSEFNGPTVSGDWNVTLQNADVEITSRFPLMEQTLRQVFSPPLGPIQVTGKVEGTLGKVNFHVSSPLGRVIAQALSETFKRPMQTAFDTIHDELSDRFLPHLAKLKTRVRHTSRLFDERMNEALLVK